MHKSNPKRDKEQQTQVHGCVKSSPTASCDPSSASIQQLWHAQIKLRKRQGTADTGPWVCEVFTLRWKRPLADASWSLQQVLAVVHECVADLGRVQIAASHSLGREVRTQWTTPSSSSLRSSRSQSASSSSPCTDRHVIAIQHMCLHHLTFYMLSIRNK